MFGWLVWSGRRSSQPRMDTVRAECGQGYQGLWGGGARQAAASDAEHTQYHNRASMGRGEDDPEHALVLDRLLVVQYSILHQG